MRDSPLQSTRPPRSAYALALMVLLGSLLVVAMYWRSAYQREMRAAQADFASDTAESAALIYQRLGNYELFARGGVSLFASLARPSRQQWQEYVEGLDIGTRFPALAGLGFALYASPGELAELQRTLHQGEGGLFMVRPHGYRAHYGTILYLEPKTQPNLTAIGFDMYSEPIRRAAMDAAMASGEPRLSGRILLVQDSGQPIGAVELFLPVYRSGDRTTSIAARRESLQGWIYAPFRIRQFVAVALKSHPSRAWLRIVDVTGPGEQEIYSDARIANAPPPAFRNSIDLERYGRRWRLDFESEPVAVVEEGIDGLRSTILVGVFASLLLFAIMLTLATTQARAQRMAEQMSESYRRSELRFRGAMQYSAIGKALLDQQGRILEANPALARLVGRTPDALQGREFETLFADEASPIRERDMAEGAYRTTRMLLQDNGGIRHAQLTYAAVPGTIGDDVARLVQIDDITDRLRAEAQVLALNRTLEARVEARTRELTRANQELETFAYSVSHDLRAPLRAIDGFSRLLVEQYSGQIGDQGRGYLTRVRNAAGRMGMLIESMLKMARLGRGAIKPVDVDLSRMATEIIADVQAADPHCRIEVLIAPGLQVQGDAGLLRSLLQNLLANAWKFSCNKPGARIEFGRDAAGDFFVRDNGAGFAQEYADKLFRPFQRLHNEVEFPGDGIGLASVKRIVERHGGSVRAQGKPGEGATFWFSLPDTAVE